MTTPGPTTVAALAAGSAGAVLGGGLAPGDGSAPDWTRCAGAAAGALAAVLAVLAHRRAGRPRPDRVPAAGLLLLGGALPAAATSRSPLLAALVAAAAVLTAAGTAAGTAAVTGAAAALAACAAAGVAAPSVTAAVLGSLAGVAGLLLVAARHPTGRPDPGRTTRPRPPGSDRTSAPDPTPRSQP